MKTYGFFLWIHKVSSINRFDEASWFMLTIVGILISAVHLAAMEVR